MHEKIILGIDPGTTIMGFGLIKIVKGEMQFMQLNELILSKSTTITLSSNIFLTEPLS